jgi:hypothetical protein
LEVLGFKPETVLISDNAVDFNPVPLAESMAKYRQAARKSSLSLIKMEKNLQKQLEPPPYPHDLKIREDGYLDMRMMVNQQYAALPKDSKGKINQNTQEAIAFKLEHTLDPTPEEIYILPPPYPHDLMVKEDGYLDMRTKANKQYAALPKDSRGKVDQNSPEAIAFKLEHIFDPTPISTGLEEQLSFLNDLNEDMLPLLGIKLDGPKEFE